MNNEKTSQIPPMQFRINKGGGRGGGPMAQMMPGAKAKNFKGTLKRLLKYVAQFKAAVIFSVLFSVLATLFEVVSPKVLGLATTELWGAATDARAVNMTYIGKIVLALIFLYLLSSFFSFFQSFLTAGFSQKITYQLRRDISKKLDLLPVGYYESKTQGEIISRITNDVDTVAQTLNQGITQAITSVVTLIGISAVMLSISVRLALVVLIILPVVLVLVRGLVKISHKHYKAQQRELGNLNGHVEEMYSGHNVVKAFNGEEKSIEEFEVYNARLFESGWKSQAISGIMMPAVNFVGNAGYVAVCILGGFMVVSEKILLGDVQAFLKYVRQFTRPIREVSNIFNVFQSTAAAAERVFEFLDEKEEIPDSAESELKDVSGDVEFKNVRFGYTENKIIIKNLSAKITHGSRVAIVGPTGAGKTTIVKLLMRYYDVNSGSITVDGTDIRSVTRNNLRNQFSMVLQDAWLFNGTIMENIRYGRLSATDDDVYAAARAACVDSFVSLLPDGYNTQINEETTNISHGQKQLITIARAILANSKILILDEATSSVDTRTEILIQQALSRLTEGKTTFVIAHRLSTIKESDFIFVVNDGDIVEQGTHRSLLDLGGFYASLYNSQFNL